MSMTPAQKRTGLVEPDGITVETVEAVEAATRFAAGVAVMDSAGRFLLKKHVIVDWPTGLEMYVVKFKRCQPVLP